MDFRTRAKKWMTLILALFGVIGFIVSVEKLSPRLPGTAGMVYRQNVEEKIEATALIWTESGDVGDYIDRQGGKYSRSADLTHDHPKSSACPLSFSEGSSLATP